MITSFALGLASLVGLALFVWIMRLMVTPAYDPASSPPRSTVAPDDGALVAIAIAASAMLDGSADDSPAGSTSSDASNSSASAD
jgi:hypothetical protein